VRDSNTRSGAEDQRGYGVTAVAARFTFVPRKKRAHPYLGGKDSREGKRGEMYEDGRTWKDLQ